MRDTDCLAKWFKIGDQAFDEYPLAQKTLAVLGRAQPTAKCSSSLFVQICVCFPRVPLYQPQLLCFLFVLATNTSNKREKQTALLG